MIPIIINNENYNLPQNYSEVTMQQYLQIVSFRNELNQCRLLSIFTGIEYDELIAYSLSVFDEKILEMLNEFDGTISFAELPVPEFIELNGRTINIPKDINEETFGQKILLHEKINMMQEAEGNLINILAFAAATYLQPGYDKEKFNDKKVFVLEKELLKMPVTTIYPIGNFFLNSSIKSLQKSNTLKLNLKRQKTKQESHSTSESSVS